MTADSFHEDLRSATRDALTTLAGGDEQTVERWHEVVGPLGLAGLLIDEQHGGLDLGEQEMTLVSEEIGRLIPTSPFLPTTVLGATLLQNSQTEGADRMLSDVASGASTVVVAVGEQGLRWLAEDIATTAAESDDDSGVWRLTGCKPCAIGAAGDHAGQTVLVLAATEDGVALFAVEQQNARCSSADMLDPTRGLTDVEFDSAPARMVGSPITTPSALAASYRRGMLAVSAEQLGVARTCLESAVEHAKSRVQFGSPIGSFQAIKHRCADVLCAVEMAAAALEEALGNSAEAAATELAFLTASRAAIFAAESSIHIHGGTGFTWEHPAHRYLRRARVNAEIFGATSYHREVIAKSATLFSANEPIDRDE